MDCDWRVSNLWTLVMRVNSRPWDDLIIAMYDELSGNPSLRNKALLSVFFGTIFLGLVETHRTRVYQDRWWLLSNPCVRKIPQRL